MVTAHCQGCVLQKTASLLLTILEDLARHTLPKRQAAKIKNATSENNLHVLVVKYSIYVDMLSTRLGYNGCRNFYANICNSVTANLSKNKCNVLAFVNCPV